MRALWSLVVVCLVAATGAPTQQAAGAAPAHEQLQLRDHRAPLPVVSVSRREQLRAASRSLESPALPLAVLSAAPALPPPPTSVLGEARARVDLAVSVRAPTCRARGPPAAVV